ncbi:tetratricopeptide repeat protein [Streptomyces sp. NPDC093097]|uniref:tetratricopeptide repeat protein n=1 Tax=Streptomyces sp. NPDC093097 TaxID=3366027 RepID=UPI003824AECB
MSGTASRVAAQQVFTNRSDETAAFARSLDELHASLDAAAISPVADRVQGRRNVLTFYGVGGIGKTTLSHELERRFLAEAEAEGRNDVVSVRVELSEEGAHDIETLLLRLRAGLGRLGSHWPAFDLALASYWARAHPGEPLQEFLDASPMVRRASRSAGLSEQISQNIGALVPEVGGLAGLAQRAALLVYRAIRERVRAGQLLAECELFAELIEADADYESLSFFPYLLAWDLDRQAGRGTRPKVCVFLDTFEFIDGRVDRTAERFLQRCVYLMPNVLFVLTGRNRVTWADSAVQGELDFTGPECWPNLHHSNTSSEPRQHLVGYLSESDAHSYLCEALTRDGDPVMPADVRERIVSGGQGLPLYLDLSVSHYAELLARGRRPGVGDFGGSFTAVATRSIRDLPREERDLVRTAALIDRVDADLLRAGQPSLPEGVIARFLRRPFLTHDDAYDLPHSLHLALRTAVRGADQGLPDGWSDRDRTDVAARLLRRLGERLGESAGRAATAQALALGLRVADSYGVFDDWLARAAQRLVAAGQWTEIGAGLTADAAGVPEYRAIRAAIQGVQLRRSGHARRAVEVLDGADAGIAPTSLTAQLVRLHLAHALRNHGDYNRAAEYYRGLLSGEFASAARYWLADYDYLNGRFATALAALEHRPERDAADEGERLRLIGHIWRVNARFDKATDAYTRAVALARTEGLLAAEAKALANLAQTTCWSGTVDAVTEAAVRGKELLDLVPNPVELVKIRSAESVGHAVAGDRTAALAALADTRELADGIGYRGGHNLADVAAVLISKLAGDLDEARRVRARLDDRTRASGGNTYWVPIVTTWIEGVDAAAAREPAVDWVDGSAPALARWARIGEGARRG